MSFFKSAFSRLSCKRSTAVSANMCLDTWCHIDGADPTRVVQKVEMCTALSAGDDAWGSPVNDAHYHTLLRVILAPPSGTHTSQDSLLIERVLSTGGSYHSVTPVADSFSKSGTLFHPDVHDRVCVVSKGPATAVAHDLETERTVTFDDSVRLTLARFAQILDFISRVTTVTCAGGDCKFQSRSFAFTCMTALTPRLPPPRMLRKGVSMNGSEGVDDSVFELSAEALLGQIPWLVRDSASAQTASISVDVVGDMLTRLQLRSIEALKDESRKKVKTRLYH